MKPKNILTEILIKSANVSKPGDVVIKWEGTTQHVGNLRTASRAIGNSKIGANVVKVLLAVMIGIYTPKGIQGKTRMDKTTVSKALTKLVKIGAITKTMGGAYLIADAALMPDKPIQVEFTMDEFFGLS